MDIMEEEAVTSERIGGNEVDLMSSKFGWPEYLVFGLMLAISAGIGLFYAYQGRRKNTTGEFLLGGRQMGTFPIAASLMASFTSAVAILGTPAEVYSNGTLYWMVVCSYTFVLLATAYIYLPVFFDLQLTSAYEYLELRFSKSVRRLGSFLFVIQSLIYTALVVYAPSLAVSQVTGMNVYGSVAAIFVICTFYTAVGGMKAVVWTDTFQVLVMFAALLAVIIKGGADVGGHKYVWQVAEQGGRIQFANWNMDPRTRHSLWALIIGGFFNWLNVYGCNQAQVQRYLCVATKRKAQLALFLNFFALFAIVTLCCYAGLVIYAGYSTCDPLRAKRVGTADQIFPLFVMDTLGHIHGLPGLFVACIFSAALSSVSSCLNSLAAITLEDFIKPLVFLNISDARATRISKLLSLFYGVICFGLVFVAEQLGGVLQAVLSVSGMIGGPLLGLFTLGMFFPWTNWIGAFVGCVIAFLFDLWILVGAQVAIANKDIVPQRLPTSIEGCLGAIGNFTVGGPPPPPPENEGLINLYKISYMWYSAIGCCLTVLLAIPISFATKPDDPRKLNPKLISPAIDGFVRSLLPEKILKKIGWEIGANFQKLDNEPVSEDVIVVEGEGGTKFNT